ncbi:YER087W [Saccharomyces arboricola H-6]|uniref:proline--tRNA ligase n=1 Tax=Saccharomyces arboricola (strain H-6 / AS 2.3317 / CBS 10644) TaxID=1160507 RepID=J8Q5R2_SACAR|nr:YER087W [Saccharomyces arboricola H-6]
MLKYRTLSRSCHFFHPKSLSNNTLKSETTQELLQTLGFIRRSQAGLFQWLPLGLRSLNKLTDTIRNRMENDGEAIEVALSAISSKSLWQTTGRWNNSELFKFKDTKGKQYCLTATCEEDITDLMKNYITSYKDMPITVYQMTRKYRDEIRPRGGLLRGREFLMKDAYSFASNKEDAFISFQKLDDTYNKIFKDIKIPFVSAWADSGDIGGEFSKEFHLIHESGEDTLMSCKDCGDISTLDMSQSYPEKDGQYLGDVDCKYALTKNHSTLLCFYYPKDRHLNWNLALKVMDQDIDLTLRDKPNDHVLKVYQTDNEDIMFGKILRVMDCRLNSKSNFPDFPLKQYLKNNFGQIDDVSIVDAQENEICGKCEEGSLRSFKSIEVGHIFLLGNKYSKPLNVKFVDKENKSDTFVHMGCYGIGVSRLVGAVAELGRDSNGFRWPAIMAPYKVSICTGPNNEENLQRTKDVQLKLLEDSSMHFQNNILKQFNEKLGIGARIKLSHAMGIPLCIIVGSNNWPNVEIEVRGIRWGKKDQWRKELEKKGQELEWKCPENENGIEKHTVPIEHLAEVVGILLKDM